MKKRIAPADFKELFEIPISEFANRVGYSRQNMFQIFRGAHGCSEADYMAKILEGYADKIYQRDLEIIEHNKERAYALIEQLRENARSQRETKKLKKTGD